MSDADGLQKQAHSVRRREAPRGGGDLRGFRGVLAARELRGAHADAEAGKECA